MIELGILLAPLAALLINGLFGRRYIKESAHYIAIAGVVISFLISVVVFFKVMGGYSLNAVVYEWVIAGDVKIPFGILVDGLTAYMLIVVTFVSTMVHIYSVGYMHKDPGYWRFFTYLSIFTFSMLILVLGNNFFMLFVGWELVGLSSYLLIGFWFEKKSAADANKKAFVVNRIGDFGFYIGLLLVIITFRSLNYSDAFNIEAIESIKGATFNVFGIDLSLIDLMTFGLFCGAIGKSAQFPLHVWLPDAMEGPTPVSALIHAATMVTAGVYMVARCNPLFSEAVVTSNIIVYVGMFTALLGATIGLTQFDLKRILAYSTVSQLGYMIMATGAGAYIAAIFHLFTHAFFKGLLFLGSGSVMHAMENDLDIRKMGGLKAKMPTTRWTYLVGCMAISGAVPLMSGWFSKDEILLMTFASGHYFPWLITAGVGGLTAFYMFRSYFLVFEGTPRDQHKFEHAHESPSSMTIPLILLAIPAVLAGVVFGLPLENGIIHKMLHGVLVPHAADVHHVSHATAYGLMILSTIIGIIGIYVAYMFYIKKPDILPAKTAKAAGPIYKLFYNKWYFDEIYQALIVNPIVTISRFLWKGFDANVIDFTVNAFGHTARFLGQILRYIQTGRIQTYIFTMVVGVILLLTIFYMG
jgi:NADH-quinone oxidoreductase subunit L